MAELKHLKKSSLSKFTDKELIEEVTRRGHHIECAHALAAKKWKEKYMDLLNDYIKYSNI
jgi:hypothetical protein